MMLRLDGKISVSKMDQIYQTNVSGMRHGGSMSLRQTKSPQLKIPISAKGASAMGITKTGGLRSNKLSSQNLLSERATATNSKIIKPNRNRSTTASKQGAVR